MASSHGGKREGAGRKPVGHLPAVRKTVTLPPEHIEYLIDLGAGNLSLGIRRLIERTNPDVNHHRMDE